VQQCYAERDDLAAARPLLIEAVADGVSTGANACLFHGAPALEFVPAAPGAPTATSRLPSTVSWPPGWPQPAVGANLHASHTWPSSTSSGDSPGSGRCS
jgi:hypothetical protein